MQQGKPGRRSSTTPSTCSRSTASRSSTCRSPSGGSGSRSCSTAAAGPCGSRRPSTTARRCSRPRDEQGLEGVDGQARRLALPAGQAQPRLAQGEDARPAGVRRRRLHAGPGPAGGQLRLARPRRPARAASCATSATVGTGFAEDEIDRLLGGCARSSAPDRRSRRRRRCRASARATCAGSSRGSSRGRVRRVDARRPPARAGLPGTARRQAARRTCRASEPLRRRVSKGASARSKLLEPRQGLLARGGDHEGRPARLLPRRRAGARAAPARPAVHDAALPGRRAGKDFFQKDAPAHMPEWIPTLAVAVHAREPRREADDPLPARERRARAALDGQHGLHRHEPWYSRVDRPDRPDFVLFDLDPPPDVGFGAVDRGGAARQRGARRARARVPEDERRRTGSTCSSRSSAARPTPTRASSPRSSPARSRARTAARHDGVVEGEAPRRPDRREPERRGEDDRVGLLGAAAPGAPVSTPLRWDEVNEG